MQILFLGVGDACDPEHGNTSVHVTTAGQLHVLFDCGFTTPHTYFRDCIDPDQLDILWISHFHGDHFFGTPLLLLRFREMGRTKPLVIAGQSGIAETVSAVMDLAYPRFFSKLTFDLLYREIEPGRGHELNQVDFRTVETDHSQRNLGLLIDDGAHRFYYSGDGRPTGEVVSLVKDCDLVVHEAFRLNDEVRYHGSVAGCLKLAAQSHLKRLALVHLDRSFRRNRGDALAGILAEHPCVTFPVDGSEVVL